MNSIYSPAMSIIDKLNYSRKFLLLSLIIISIIIILSIALYAQFNKTIDRTNLQLEGIEKVVAVNDIIQVAQQYRGTSIADQDNNPQLIGLHRIKEQELERMLYTFIRSLDPAMRYYHDSKSASDIINLWKQLTNSHMVHFEEQGFQQHSDFIRHLRLLIWDISEHYQLATDEDSTPSYMITLLLHNIPEATEKMGVIRARMLKILSNKRMSDKEKEEMVVLNANYQQSSISLQFNLQKIIRTSPILAAKFNAVYTHVKEEHLAIIELNKTILNEQSQDISAKYWGNMTKNIDSLYQLMHSPITSYLVNHLKQRKNKSILILTIMVSVAVLLLAVASYFLMALYQSLLRNIQDINAVVNGFSQDDFSSRIILRTNDEMNLISTAINLMAERITQTSTVLKEEQERFKVLFEQSSEGHIIIEDGQFTNCNEKAVAMLGYNSKIDLLKSPASLSPEHQPDGKLSSEKAELLIKQCLDSGTNNFEWVHQKKNGTDIWVDVSLTKITNQDSDIIYVTWRDISLQKRTNAKNELRRKQHELSNQIFNNVSEAIIVTDHKGLIINANPAYSKITGFSRKEVIGQWLERLSPIGENIETYKNIWKTVNQQGYWKGEIWNRRKNGEHYAELLSVSLIKDDLGNTLHTVGIFTDITDIKKQQQKLEMMAHYDVLTKLPNRVLFADRMRQSVAHTKRTNALLAVCFLDLDNFKPINDNYGHDVGDKILVEVAKRIKVNVREEDTASRQGGDEFTILLGNIKNYAQVEQTIQRIHDSLSRPYLINEQQHFLTASTGITMFPLDNNDIGTLVRHADQAMYQAKQLGRNRYHLFNAEEEQKTIQKHHRLEAIKQALTNGELCLYYQPKVNMNTGKVFGAEALIRWQHPENGLIPPLDFLPIIEGTELEVNIGNWVILEALVQLDIWNKNDIQLQISINISSHHLQSSDFLKQLEESLNKFPLLDRKSVQLEILESSALGDLKSVSSVIKTCQEALGISIALDDFGTGYSSLTHLRNLSANTIKIDRTFVRDMLDDPNDYAIIEAILGLAESFNSKVIAEGIETTSQGVLLQLMGCKEAQGYVISKPLPANEIPKWLAQYIANPVWLSYDDKKRTDKERALELLQLCLLQWASCFKDNIESPTDSIKTWPIINSHECLCEYLIKRIRNEELFNKSWLKSFSEKHQEHHHHAETLISLYESGDINKAREEYREFQYLLDETITLLGATK